MFTRLLVGLDGSPGADAALEAAVGLARRFKGTLVLATVIDIRLLEAPLYETAGPLWTEGVSAGPAALDLREALDARAAAILENAAAVAAAAGLVAETARAVGLIEEELTRLAADAEAIVVGRRGELHAEPGSIGAVTTHLVKRASKPIFIAGERPSECRRPVVAYDGGETSGHALELAARCADALDLPLAVVHVCDDPAAGDAVLGKASAYLSTLGVAFETRRLEGEVPAAVARFVVEYDGDLLVVGAHGGRRRPFAIGSHAVKLLRASTVPVIIHR